jgi:hypothetical protein
MKIGPVILAVVLFGASAMQASFAEDAATPAGHPGGSNPSAEPSGSPPPPSDAGGLVGKAKSDTHAPVENAAGPKSEDNAGTEEGHSTSDKQNLKASVDGGPKGRGVKTPSGDTSAIDTRITAPSRHSRNTLGKAPDAKSSFRIIAPGNIHARPLPASLKPPERNAIGQPAAPRDGIRGRNDDSHVLPPHNSAPAVAGTAPGAAGGSTGTKAGLERPTIAHSNPSPIVSAPVVQRGAITGTGLVRPNSAPLSLGGPAKVVAGINGTSTRPKH